MIGKVDPAKIDATLYDAFDPADDLSVGRCLDYRTYLATLAQGQPIPRSRGIVNGRALHDAAITFSLAERVVDARSVGILGGHGEHRGSKTYNSIARIGYGLAQRRPEISIVDSGEHLARFDDQTSTFIVETPEHVWRGAGLDLGSLHTAGGVQPEGGSAGQHDCINSLNSVLRCE